MANPEYEWKRNDWYGMKNVCLHESQNGMNGIGKRITACVENIMVLIMAKYISIVIEDVVVQF